MCANATRRIAGLSFVAVATGSLLFAAPAQAINLCAGAGTVTMPDGVSVDIWGFALDTGGPGCDVAIPGPVIDVTQGDPLTVNLRNTLAESVAIEFPGQALPPDTIGAGPGGGTTSYSFTPEAPGTYLYEAGLNPGIQIPMGLYGALIVRPAGDPGQAYDDATTAFDVEQVLVLSEIDPALNSDPGGFDRTLYDPVYWLINGKAYPDTDPIPVPPDNTLLLRYLNAGSTHHTMTLLGKRQRLIAIDSDPLVGTPDLSQSVASQTIPAGQTTDALVIAPAAPGRFPLYNRQMNLTNALPGNPAHFPGGMMTFITVPAQLFFSTAGNSAVPGVCPTTAPNACDDADIYAWSGAAFGRVFDASGVGLLAGANIDALVVVDFDTFYMSFTTNEGTAVPTLGTVQDEDIVKYDAGIWSMYFDGGDVGLSGSANEDVDAFEILADGSIVISTIGPPTVIPAIPTPPTPQDEDLLRCVGTFGSTSTCAWTLYFEGSDVGLSAADDPLAVPPVNEDVDGTAVDGSDIYLSTLGAFAVAGIPSGAAGDVFVCNGVTLESVNGTTACTSLSMFLDASAEALTANIDAFDLP